MSPDLEESGEWAFRGSLQEESAEAATGQASITSKYAAASGSFRGVRGSVCGGGPSGQAREGRRCSGIYLGGSDHSRTARFPWDANWFPGGGGSRVGWETHLRRLSRAGSGRAGSWRRPMFPGAG